MEGLNQELINKYMNFLTRYPEIFSDLVTGALMNFALYDSIHSFYLEEPLDAFHVLKTNNGIEMYKGASHNSDLELSLSTTAVDKLLKTSNKEEYLKLLGFFYNEPDEKKGWVDFILHKRTVKIINLGYGRFAEKAGIKKEY
jgi:hypothetical protein